LWGVEPVVVVAEGAVGGAEVGRRVDNALVQEALPVSRVFVASDRVSGRESCLLTLSPTQVAPNVNLPCVKSASTTSFVSV
jgi:hypothetical protein